MLSLGSPTDPIHLLKGTASKYDVWAIGISIVCSGAFISWNEGLASGFEGFFLSTVIVGLSYLFLCLCISELSSTLPFAGGSYGLARCTLGFYFGYIVGCCEILEYVIAVAFIVLLIGQIIVDLIPAAVGYEPVIWVAVLGPSLIVHVVGGRTFWHVNMAFAVVAVLSLVIYCLGCIKFVDFKEYAHAEEYPPWFRGDVLLFSKHFPTAMWYFLGLEGICLTAGEAIEPRKSVPFGQTASILVWFVSAMFVVPIAVSIPMGIEYLAESLTPLSQGYALMFDINPRSAAWISIPSIYASAYALMYCYGKLIVSMADSHLLPENLTQRHPRTGAPVKALLVGTIGSFVICLVAHEVEFVSEHLFSLCVISALVAYISQCIGFAALRLWMSHLPREFRNPLGIPSAVAGLVVWIYAAISTLFFQEDNYFTVIAFSVICFFLSLYYYFFVRERQAFSAEENEILLNAHAAVHVVTRKRLGRQTRRTTGLWSRVMEIDEWIFGETVVHGDENFLPPNNKLSKVAPSVESENGEEVLAAAGDGTMLFEKKRFPVALEKVMENEEWDEPYRQGGDSKDGSHLMDFATTQKRGEPLSARCGGTFIIGGSSPQEGLEEDTGRSKGDVLKDLAI